MRKSFTWFLSLLVLLTAFATNVFAQEDQETVELYAEDATPCYNEGDDYTVTIAVKDFIRLDSFELALVFNDDVFQYEDVTVLNSSLTAGLTVSKTTNDIIDIVWDGTSEVTIGDDVKTDIMTLHFSLIGFPGNSAPSYVSDMDWGTADFWYNNGSVEDPVNTVVTTDGSLTVSVDVTGVETELSTEDCFGGDVTVTVTAPDADQYLFNEDANPANWTAWSPSNEYLAAAGETVTVRLKDASGCISLQKVVEIPESIDPITFTVETQNPTCYGGKGSVVISAHGGNGGYTYYISPDSADMVNAIPKSNFQFSQDTGTFWVWVDDANSCAEDLAWQMITIEDLNTEVTGTIDTTHVTCNGGNDGQLVITVLEDGGAAADSYQVSVDGGNTWGTLDDFTIEGLTAGDYQVVVRNTEGCEIAIGDATINQPAAITFDVSIDDVSCGEEGDGSITVNNITPTDSTFEVSVDGGITWVADGGPADSSAVAGEITVGDLDPTYYSIHVRVVGSTCTPAAYSNPNGSGNVVAVQSPDAISFDVDIMDPLCHNDSASVEIVDVAGGTGSYIYSFDGGLTWVDTTTIDIWDYMTVALDIQVSDADTTCTVAWPETLDAADVINPDSLIAYVDSVFAPTCIDGNDGNIHLNITGGTEPYYYSINGSIWKEVIMLPTSIKVNVGTHQIMVMDANDCEIAVPIDTTVTLEESIIEAVSDGNIDCYGDKTGTISVNFTSWAEGLTGGVPNRDVQYWVENEAGVVSAFGPSNIGLDPDDVTTFNAGTYIVTVQDQYTCMSNPDTVVITENDELLITDVNANGASCFESFDGIITITATGGNASAVDMLEYAIVNNEGALENLEEDDWLPFTSYNDIDFDPAVSTVSFYVDGGTYWVAVRDGECDEKTWGPVPVTGYEELLVDEDDIEPMDPLCYGEATGSITVPPTAVSGGAGAYKYTLLDGGMNPIEDYIDLAAGEFTGLADGTYYVLVEDAEDCPPYTTGAIILVDPAELTYTTSIKHMSCAGSNDGTITIDVTGGTPGYKYAINSTNTWFNFGFEADGVTPIATKTYIATEPGTYVVWVSDANDCEIESDTVTILEPEEIGVSVVEIDSVSCNGSSDGGVSVQGTGGWAGMSSYQFKLNDGSWTWSTTFSGLSAGEDTIYVKDANLYGGDYQQLDCESSVIFTVGEPEIITYDVVISDVKCKDGSDGEFMMEVISGGTPYVDLVGDNDGFLVRLTGTGYDSGWLYTGADNAHTFTGLAPSHYGLEIMDANGCTLHPPAVPSPTEGPYTTQESWEVNEPDEYLDFDAMWIKDATCYGSEDGEFEVVATGGTGPYMYAASLSIPPNGGGHILVPTPDEDSEADEYFTGWLPNDTLMVGAGTWVVWVMDANGCIKGGEYYDGGEEAIDWRVQIEQPDSIMWAFHMVGDPAVVHYVQPSCFGEWDGSIHIASITGGSGTYNARVWGTSAAGAAVDTTYTDIEVGAGSLYWLSGVPASDSAGFEVTVMDDNDCVSAIDTIFIDQPEMLTVSLEKVDGFNCYGDNDGQIEAYPEGGTPDYEYQLWKNGVIHTPWQDLGSSFLVQAGNEFIVGVRDDNGCEAYDTIYIETPQKVEWTNDRLTCHGDTIASVRINATGTPGRVFSVWYQEVNNGVPASGYVQYNGTFEESILIDDVFLYDNENFIDRHYAVYVEDDEGCPSEIDTLTFDAVATPLTMNVLVSDITECSETMNISYMGGTADYTVMFSNPNLGIVDSVLTEDMYVAGRGPNTIKVMDSHECVVDTMIEVEGVYVTRDTTIETYFERSTSFVDVEGGVDEMLAVGIDTFIYDISENCKRTLIVEVVEVSPAQDIMSLQGGASSSPWVGYIVELDGTITGISDNEGFYMQDANEAWSGVWVQWLDTEGLSIGDGVLVKGETAEVTGVTTINAESVSGATAPVVVEAVVLDSPAETKAEMWESVLVKVESATAAAVNEATGEWIISYTAMDNAVVNDQMFSFAPVAEHVYHVTGVVSGRLDVYKVEPRMMSDIEPAAIKTVQGAASASPYVGTTVELMGTVSGVSPSEGFYMQDANEAWSGIWVQWTDTEELAVGDGVMVVGPIAEVSAVTTINATSVMEMTSDLTLEPIVLGSPSEVSDEMYESVLVMVDGARGTEADEITGEWTVYYEMMDDATVNDLMYSYEPTDGNFYDVTGVVNGRLDDYKLEPRMEEDIVDLTATPTNPRYRNVEFGVYPNPFNDRINLKNSDKLSRVVISNIAGQRVIDIKYPRSEIRTARLVSGVYIVSMYTEDGIAKSVRIVKR